MAIFVTGDVHGGAEYGSSRFSSKSWPDGRTLSRDDVVVVAGDFGFVWDGSNTDRYWLDWFESKPWTTCFVDGNHENFDTLLGLPVDADGMRYLRDRIIHLPRGFRWEWGTTRCLAVGGAYSIDRILRVPGRSLMVTTTERPVSATVTRTWLPMGREAWAAVSSFSS